LFQFQSLAQWSHVICILPCIILSLPQPNQRHRGILQGSHRQPGSHVQARSALRQSWRDAVLEAVRQHNKPIAEILLDYGATKGKDSVELKALLAGVNY
jgi:hypothetical protein